MLYELRSAIPAHNHIGKILSLVLGQGFWNWTSIVDYALQLGVFGMEENEKETRSLALTPTWSVTLVLTIFVAVSLLMERSIHRLSNLSGIQQICWNFSYALKWDIFIFILFYLSPILYKKNKLMRGFFTRIGNHYFRMILFHIYIVFFFLFLFEEGRGDLQVIPLIFKYHVILKMILIFSITCC